MIQPLKLHQPASRRKFFLWVRISGTVSIILFTMTAMVLGLHQQTLELAPEVIDCPYRVHLMHDRLMTFLDRNSHTRGQGDEAENDFANLLAETRVACAHQSELDGDIDRLLQLFSEARTRRHQEAAARAELESK